MARVTETGSTVSVARKNLKTAIIGKSTTVRPANGTNIMTTSTAKPLLINPNLVAPEIQLYRKVITGNKKIHERKNWGGYRVSY